MSVTTRLETITPQKAQKYLDARAPNRPLSERTAKRLAGAMKAGEFEVNGETLKFDNKGQMVDGQHRCLACVLAGCSFRSFVTKGLNSSAFDTIDTGRKRTIADVFAKHSEANYKILGGACTWLWRLERGLLSQGRTHTPRHAEALATLEEHPGLRCSMIWGQRCRKILPAAIAGFLHYAFSQRDADAADWFFEHLASGEDISRSSRKSSGLYALRERLNQDKASKAKLPPVEVIKLAIKAWNAMRQGKVIKYLRHRTEGSAREQFPEIL